LDIDGAFRREEVRVAIEVGVEEHALFADFAEFVETEDLEAAGIGEDGAGPGHKFVETAEAFDAFVAGAKEEVVRVGEDDFGVEIVDEIAWRQAFDCALGADGHEDGGFDGAVGGVEEASARAGLGAGGLDFEAEGGKDGVVRHFPKLFDWISERLHAFLEDGFRKLS
jgi:hypothetical protein